jgi:1,4-alpha-glucan branching enzyme
MMKLRKVRNEVENLSEQNVKVRFEDLHFIDITQSVWNYSLLSEEAVHDFQQGKNHTLHYVFGSHELTVKDRRGFYFAVWAPNASAVSVVGDFNGWNHHLHPLRVRNDGSGIWEGFIPGIEPGSLYKYHIRSNNGRMPTG